MNNGRPTGGCCGSRPRSRVARVRHGNCSHHPGRSRGERQETSGWLGGQVPPLNTSGSPSAAQSRVCNIETAASLEVAATPPRVPVRVSGSRGRRGRPLSSAAIASSAAWSSWRRSPLRGRYWRAARWCSRWCHAAKGSAGHRIDLHAGVDGELGVLGHLPTLVPGQRAAQLLRQSRTAVVNSGRTWCAVTPSGSGTTADSGVALHQGSHRAGPLAEHQVAFPVPGHRSGRPPPGSLADARVPCSCPRPWQALPRG